MRYSFLFIIFCGCFIVFCKNSEIARSQDEIYFTEACKIFSFINKEKKKAKEFRVEIIKTKKKSDSLIFEVPPLENKNLSTYNQIEIRNDTVVIHNKYNYFELMAFKKGFKGYNGYYNIFLKKILWDKELNDSIYIFNYDWSDAEGDKLGYGLEEIWASKKRGFVKITYRDSINGNLWIGQAK